DTHPRQSPGPRKDRRPAADAMITTRSRSRTAALLARNEQWIPGGLASLNRRADPCISFARGQGAHVWDFDNNEYIDYHFGFAPYVLGHNDPDVNAAVQQAVARGLSNF